MIVQRRDRVEVERTLRTGLAFIERGVAQHAFALDAQGQPVEPRDRTAVRWCPMGAVQAASPDTRIIVQAISVLYDCVPNGEQLPIYIARVNDPNEFVDLFRRAIARVS